MFEMYKRFIYNVFMQENVNILDKEGRPLIKMSKGRIIATRYPGMDIKTKELIANIYNDLTGNASNDIIDFLNYENDGLEFCS